MKGSSTLLRPCSPRVSSAQAIRAHGALQLSLQSSSAQEGLNAHRNSSAQFAELFSSGRPQRPQELFSSIHRALQLRKASSSTELFSSVCRALQLRKASAPTGALQLSLQSSSAQKGLNAQRISSAQFAELFSSGRPQRPLSSSAQFAELFSSGRPQRPQELFSLVRGAL